MKSGCLTKRSVRPQTLLEHRIYDWKAAPNARWRKHFASGCLPFSLKIKCLSDLLLRIDIIAYEMLMSDNKAVSQKTGERSKGVSYYTGKVEK